jgi:protein-tyrosine phosphatase
MAEALLRHKIDQAGLQDRIEVDSAGISLWKEGAEPHEGTVAALKSHGIVCNHLARAIHGSDLQTFDYILAMDNEILKSIWSMGKGKARAFPIVRYAAGSGVDRVADPIRTHKFDECYDLLDKACDGFLANLRRTHSL